MGQTLNRYDGCRIERYPLPSDPEAIGSLVREIYTKEGVQALTISDGLVRAARKVDDKTLEELPATLESAISSVSVEEIYLDKGPAFLILHMIAKAPQYLTCWVVGPEGKKRLAKWSGLPVEDSFLDLQIITLSSLSEDTLLLCMSKTPDAALEEIDSVYKTVMEDTNDDSRSNHSGEGRGGSSECYTSTAELAFNSGGLRPITWVPASNSGK